MTMQGEDTVQKKGPGRPRKKSRQSVDAVLQVASAATPNITEVNNDGEGTGEVEETVTVVEPGPEPLPKGMNSGDLFASEDELELEIVHKGQTWSFTYKDLTWGDKNYCIDAAQVWEGDTFRFSVQKYYAAALTRMIIQSPIRPITDITLQKLDRAVGEKLIQIVPNPVEDAATLDEVKKV